MLGAVWLEACALCLFGSRPESGIRPLKMLCPWCTTMLLFRRLPPSCSLPPPGPSQGCPGALRTRCQGETQGRSQVSVGKLRPHISHFQTRGQAPRHTSRPRAGGGPLASRWAGRSAFARLPAGREGTWPPGSGAALPAAAPPAPGVRCERIVSRGASHFPRASKNGSPQNFSRSTKLVQSNPRGVDGALARFVASPNTYPVELAQRQQQQCCFRLPLQRE